ncbi:MAG TPA: phosphatase PAP2 family protein [Candidatus Tyrphobacter sp.]|nr:phosphatase PAP2 family protein [Candidatus Tyrphobacter sp.]
MSFDLSLFNAFYSLALNLPYLDWLFVFLADYLIFAAVFILAYAIVLEKNRKERFYHFFLGLLSVIFSWGVITQTIGFFYHRVRPFAALNIHSLISHPPTASFPSGHLAFFTPLVALAFLINKKLGVWFTVFAVLIGFARIAVGVHWPTDILGGAVIGLIGFYLAKAIIPKPALEK